ncbi:MAG: response regulator transcription factor [Nitrospira sp.]|jgi:DNA-binding NarL/FixJ family response regulator|nr:response regulator transcription factor [Nitrospira sp.]MDH4242130.1 response regulator transcription factor [Nitrospira sp.]MDH4354754.1 response regulator transcription factor [Nitrospira sp.]MDH5316765.1 response regulator transcription factor [Nitrospira sp.]
MNKPSILLADDHTLFVEALHNVLEPEFTLVGEVGDGRALLEAAPRLLPDVILLDLSMPLLNGIDAAYQLRRLVPDSKLLFLSMHGDATYVTEAFRAGAAGYVLKRSTATELLQAIRAVLRGQLYISPMLAKDMLDPLLHSKRSLTAPQKQLTIRQREVLQLVAEGRSLKEIATILCVSVKTVEFHKTRIVKQLGLSRTADLTKYAVTHGLVPV